MAKHRNFFIFTVFIFFIFNLPQNSISKIYKWEDCTKPFKKYIAGILKQRPADIEVVLPDLLNEYDEIPLVITLDPVDSHSKTYGYFTINDQPRSKAFEFILHAHREKTFQVNLKTKILKAGLNTIHFGSEHRSTIYKPYSIINLRFGFHDKKKIQELMAKSHSGEISEKDKPKISMKPYSEDKIPPKIIITSHDTSRGIRPVQNRKKVTISGRANDENGIVEIKVNNKDATFDEKGNFETDIYLKVGQNRIVVSAMDIHENRANKEFAITRVASNEPSKAKIDSTAIGSYYALVIGNNDYKYIKKLETAKNDARKVAETLKLRYGFNTNLLLDADRDAILDAINDFRRNLNQDDQFLIYYAGHGSFDKVAGKAYWLPVDAQRNNDKNWIIVDTITSNIKRISSGHILIVADSCYSGTFTRSSALVKLDSAPKRRTYLNKMQAKKSRTLLASGGNEPVSDIGGEGHSVFANAFLTGLTNIDLNEFTAEELYIKYVKEMVAGSSEQTPEYNIIRNSGHEGGDFLFKKKFASVEKENVWQDENIKITLEKMELADDYPAGIRKNVIRSDKKLPKPKKGNKYAFFLFTLNAIENVHVVSLGGRSRKDSTLSSTVGNHYTLNMWTARGIRFSDPTNISSPSELAEGAKILLVFTIPQKEKPDILSFIYSFKNQLKDSSMKKGKIKMQL